MVATSKLSRSSLQCQE